MINTLKKINTSDLRNYKRLVYLLVSIYFISNKIN